MNDYSELKNYCYRLYIGFIKQYTKAKTLKPTSEEIDNVKAFCVLSHAALEEYFEKLATKTIISAKKKFDGKSLIDKIPNNQSELDAVNNNIIQLVKTLTLSSGYYIYSKKNSDALKNYKSKLEKAAQLHTDNTILTLNDVIELTKKTDSYTNEILKETNTFFEQYISENHGASLKYLLKLLIPVGIDIPDNLSLLNSLQKLAKYRGEYAHTKGDLTVILSAPDSANYIIDALQLCKIIDDSISKFHTYCA